MSSSNRLPPSRTGSGQGVLSTITAKGQDFQRSSAHDIEHTTDRTDQSCDASPVDMKQPLRQPSMKDEQMKNMTTDDCWYSIATDLAHALSQLSNAHKSGTQLNAELALEQAFAAIEIYEAAREHRLKLKRQSH